MSTPTPIVHTNEDRSTTTVYPGGLEWRQPYCPTVEARTASGSCYRLVAPGGRKDRAYVEVVESSMTVLASSRRGEVPMKGQTFRLVGARLELGHLTLGFRAYPMGWAGSPEDFEERFLGSITTSRLENASEVADFLGGLE